MSPLKLKSADIHIGLDEESLQSMLDDFDEHDALMKKVIAIAHCRGENILREAKELQGFIEELCDRAAMADVL